jgi:hypothetical protein
MALAAVAAMQSTAAAILLSMRGSFVPNVRITCGLRLARPWQSGVMV